MGTPVKSLKTTFVAIPQVGIYPSEIVKVMGQNFIVRTVCLRTIYNSKKNHKSKSEY